MAGIFGFFDFTKPGPGVPKDAPPKHPFIVFFEILQRKFWNFVKINLMFLFFNLPAFLAGMFVMLGFFPHIIPDALDSPEGIFSDMMMKLVLLTVIMCVPMITTGPAQAGFTYILRNYSREEHAFIWGDFKDAARSNFRQSLIVGTINFIVTFLTIMAIMAYGQIQGTVGLVGLAVMFQMLLLFACMNIYIYQLMVTFELTLKQLYKNALILAIVRFIPNLLILLLTAFIVFLSFGLIFPFNPLIGLVPYLFLLVSLTGFIINFYAWRTIRKYIISRIEEEEDDDDEGEDEEDDDEDADDDEGDDEGSGNDSGDAGIGGNGRGKDQDPGTDTGAGAGVVGEDGITRYF